jgi:hypothetical protein
VRANKEGVFSGQDRLCLYPDPVGRYPHMSAQARDDAGTREILEDSLAGRPIRSEYLILDAGQLAGTGAASYSVSGTTSPGSSGR